MLYAFLAAAQILHTLAKISGILPVGWKIAARRNNIGRMAEMKV